MSSIRNINLLGRPVVEISLDRAEGFPAGSIASFSTMDKIDGKVNITAKNNTKFDDLEIAFVGIAKTSVERLSAAPSLSGHQEATHRFLRLVQPIPSADLPRPRVLEAGRTYTFPFTFVVPDQLLPRSCPHRVRNDQVKEAHLHLPPSLGDAEASSFSGRLLDDLAPEMSKIQYAVRVSLTRTREGDDEDTERLIVEKFRKVHVRPAFEEAPPLTVDASDKEYNLRVEKSIRKGMFKGRTKLGKLIVESAQPRAFMLPCNSSDANVTTVVRLNLRFDPANGDAKIEPPSLNSLQSKLKVTTFFATAPRAGFPAREGAVFDATQSYHGEAISLTQRCVASVPWTRHESSSRCTTPSEPPSPTGGPQRRPSEISTNLAETPSASSDYSSGGVYHTAHIVVPLNLPTHNKHFVPTFHTCLISRVYGISLHLSLQSAGRATPAQTLVLRVPVQVAQEGTAAREEERAAVLRLQEAGWEADEVFTPRRPTVVGDEVLGRNASLGGEASAGVERPPTYEGFYGCGGSTRSVPVYG